MNHAVFFEMCICSLNGLGSFFLRFHVIRAIHHQQMRCHGMRRKRVRRLFDLFSELRGTIRVKACAIAVGIAKVHHQHTRTIRRFPPDFSRLIIQSAPETGAIHSKSAQDLRHLSDVAEGVRHVTDRHFPAKFARLALACQQVANMRFGTHEEHIGQDMPGTDQNAPIADMFPQRIFRFGPHEQVIVKCDRLPVEHEVFVIAISGKNVEQAVHKVNKFKAELLEGAIPLAVPVSMADDMNCFHFNLTFCLAKLRAFLMMTRERMVGKRFFAKS